ncbi:MAG: insulinase family protein [Planctomycetia bacterium]|nr:insulinase family protein [Planctomycetia bacterium]
MDARHRIRTTVIRNTLFSVSLGAIAWSAGHLLPVACAAEPAEPKMIGTIEGITEYRLDNGLKVLLFPDPSKKSVTVNLTVFVGSRHEGYGEAGMAHLLEHMLFKGTPKHADIPKLLTGRGANFNGTTWYDRTNYYETMPAGDDNMEFGIRLEADRMVNSFVKGEDLKSEMTVVRNEFEYGENTPELVLSQRMMAVAYEWHNYGKSTIGNRADIERVPIASLQKFYKWHYQPDNAMLVVAGQFDAKKALETIRKEFGTIPRPARKLDETYTEEPAQDGERFVTLRRVGDVSVVGTMYHIPSGAHPDFAPIDVLESILTPAPSGRLYKALVETRKASSVSGGAYALHDPGLLSLSAKVIQGIEPNLVLETINDVVEKVRGDGVTAEETDRAKQRLLKQIELDAADSTKIAVELSNWASQGDWRLYFLYRDRIEKVTAADVQRVAEAYLRRDNRTVGIYTPVKKSESIGIPETPELAGMIGDYKGRASIAQGESFDVAPDKIEARLVRPKLPGNIKAALLSKKTRGEAVSLRITLRYGNESNLRGLATVCEFLPDLMIRGTKSLTYDQLQETLDKERAELHATGNPGEAIFTLKANRTNLPVLLDVLRQVLRAPGLREEELETLRHEATSALEQQQNDPAPLAFRALRRTLNPYEADDPRYVATIAEEIQRYKSVTRDDVKKLYDEFLGAQGELAISGDFDIEATVAALTKIFGDWKPSQPFAELRRSGDIKVSRGVATISTPEKANAVYAAGTVFPMRDDDPDYPALVMADFILGGGTLSSRLGDRVRQKEGLSYGVQSNLNASLLDKRAALSIMAICNPANMEKVKVAIDEEVALLLKSGVTAEELELAKRGYLQQHEVERTKDGSLAKILADNLRAGRSMKYYTDLEKRIHNTTPAEVLAAFRKYVDPKRTTIVEAGDFSKKPAEAKAGKQ